MAGAVSVVARASGRLGWNGAVAGGAVMDDAAGAAGSATDGAAAEGAGCSRLHGGRRRCLLVSLSDGWREPIGGWRCRCSGIRAQAVSMCCVSSLVQVSNPFVAVVTSNTRLSTLLLSCYEKMLQALWYLITRSGIFFNYAFANLEFHIERTGMSPRGG